MPHHGNGDAGVTGLPGGARVPKNHPRVEACGDLDELNSVLGALAAGLADDQSSIREEIRCIQGSIFAICAAVAAGPESVRAAGARDAERAAGEDAGRSAAGPVRGGLAASALAELDASIARMEAVLPPMRGFILPGGSPSAAQAHVARTVCRRAERRVVALGAGSLPEGVLPYLNRLSTYLFSLARLHNRDSGVAETEWRP